MKGITGNKVLKHFHAAVEELGERKDRMFPVFKHGTPWFVRSIKISNSGDQDLGILYLIFKK